MILGRLNSKQMKGTKKIIGTTWQNAMLSQKQTYCTNCKMNVDIVDGKYVRLANKRAVFEGHCSKCGVKLIKAKVMPRNRVMIKRRKRKGLL